MPYGHYLYRSMPYGHATSMGWEFKFHPYTYYVRTYYIRTPVGRATYIVRARIMHVQAQYARRAHNARRTQDVRATYDVQPSKKYPLWGYFFTSRKPLRGYMHDMHEKNTPYGAIFSEKIPPIRSKSLILSSFLGICCRYRIIFGIYFLKFMILGRQFFHKFSPFGLNLWDFGL